MVWLLPAGPGYLCSINCELGPNLAPVLGWGGVGPEAMMGVDEWVPQKSTPEKVSCKEGWPGFWGMRTAWPLILEFLCRSPGMLDTVPPTKGAPPASLWHPCCQALKLHRMSQDLLISFIQINASQHPVFLRSYEQEVVIVCNVRQHSCGPDGALWCLV
jgi:hypothetical protein